MHPLTPAPEPISAAAPAPAKVGRPLLHTPEQLLDRLAQAMIDLLTEQGGNADVSVAQIAARAKVSKRTVYTVIASKEELIAHVIRRDAQAVTGMLDSPVQSANAARATLAHFLARWAHLACSPAAVGIFVMAIRERNRYPALGAAYQGARLTFGLQKLAAWLARMDAQQFIAVSDPALSAEFLLTLAASEPQRQLALGSAAPPSDAALERRVAAILALVLSNGLP